MHAAHKSDLIGVTRLAEASFNFDGSRDHYRIDGPHTGPNTHRLTKVLRQAATGQARDTP